MKKPFQLATGAELDAVEMNRRHGKRIFRAASFGLTEQARPISNTFAINLAVRKASREGGGTVVIGAGIYPVYTIELKSHVTLHLEKGAILREARPDPSLTRGTRGHGENGNVLPPEVNPFAGPQDGGHSYFANSLLYGHDLEDIAVTGEGWKESFLDGSSLHEKNHHGFTEYILRTDDPAPGRDRHAPGHRGTWFGNKAVSLVRCTGVSLENFGVLIGGHFAFMLEGCTNVHVGGVLLDTARDAFDLDCCQDVTVENSWFNSPNDDALCMKASFGAGKFMPARNMILRDCTVSGFDAGTVFDGTFRGDRVAALDRCGPTGRVKFGTEATCGLDTVLIRNIRFIRSRGLCLESCDCADMHDILAENLTMEDVSSSPIFLRVGDRGRFPVTGYYKDSAFSHAGDIRMTSAQWCFPDTEEFPSYPAVRYQTAVRRDFFCSPDGRVRIGIPNAGSPCIENTANLATKDGKTYRKVWDETKKAYVPDYTHEIPERERILYANGVGAKMARAWNIVIRNVTVKNADPRYPILLFGLSDSRIRDVVLENLDIEYRGGMTREMAVWQRQQNTRHCFSMRGTRPLAQILPWQVNSFFAKSEALLPRLDYDPERDTWTEDPFNVPERVDAYPEPSDWGILPAFGIYARHVEGLTVRNAGIRTIVPDTRDAVVLDDAKDVRLEGVRIENGEGDSAVTLVTDPWRRKTGMEFVPDAPYHEEIVENLSVESCTGLVEKKVDVCAPAPGTPPDAAYPFSTLPVPENGCTAPENICDLPLPVTVFPPYVLLERVSECRENEPISGSFRLVDPAGEEETEENRGIFVESSVFPEENPTVPAGKRDLTLRAWLSMDGEKVPVTLEGTGEGNRYHFHSERLPAGREEILLHVRISDGTLVTDRVLPIRVQIIPGGCHESH